MSSLDLKLRIQMRQELRGLQRRLRQTTVFVTHDQTEALSLSDRIAVLSQGQIEQIGTPEEIYNNPVSCFVADFIGNRNMLSAEVVGKNDGECELSVGAGLRMVATGVRNPSKNKVTVMIRPERISIVGGVTPSSGVNTYSGKVVERSFLGEDVYLRVAVEGVEPLLLAMKACEVADAISDGTAVRVHVQPRHVMILER
jgi:ABC-type Fe3+/spermidine/putrescine transport system ATPase subunit